MSNSAVIASGNRLLRQEIRNRLTQEGVLCAGEVGDLRDLLGRCADLKPHVALLDAAYGEEIFEVIGRIARDGTTQVIVLGDELDPNLLRQSMQSGARDFILVRSEGQRLGQAIRRAVALVATPETPARPASGPGKVIAVFSTKGGVGKTTIASNLAAALAAHCGKDTALVDLDLEFGGVASMFGVHPQATVVDLCRLDAAIDHSLVAKVMVSAKLDTGPRQPGRPGGQSGKLRILAAPQSPDLAAEVDGDARRKPGHNYVGEILSAIADSTPYVVVDMGSSFRDTNLTALDRADAILLVTTPDILALQNTGKCLEILLHRLEYPREKITLVINQADTAVGVTIQEISRGLDFPVSHRLVRDARTVIWAANCGQPFVLTSPRTKVAEGLIALARQFTTPNGEAREAAK
ncbi:MAG: P-loop NTPase [Bacillota bacterium]|nr:P-loop NTPase [Bacillota bacterium]